MTGSALNGLLRLAAWLCASGGLLFGFVGCADQAGPPALEISVERTGATLFAASFRPQSRASGIAFRRPAAGFRASVFRPAPGLSMRRFDGFEALTSDDGDRAEFKVTFSSYDGEVPGDYPFAIRWSDGGASLYLGHLDGVPFVCEGECNGGDVATQASSGSAAHFSLRGSPGEGVVADEQEWAPAGSARSSASGSFAYFGRTRPIEADGYRALIDPALPSWARSEALGLLPRLLALYRARLGEALPRRPLVAIAWADRELGGGLSSSGAVAGPRLEAALFGPRWEDADDSEGGNLEELRLLLAHEAFHLWNAFAHRPEAAPEARWVHEGGADAMALRSLAELRTIDADRASELANEALNRCLLAVARRPLAQTGIESRFRPHYDCGAAMNWIADGASRRAGGAGAWEIWAGAFARAVDGGYGREQWLSSAVDAARGDAAMTAVARSLRELGLARPERPDAWASSSLRALGFSVDSGERRLPWWYRRSVSDLAIEILALASAPGRGRGVVELEGIAMPERAAQAYDAAYATCARAPSSSLAVVDESGEFAARCAPLPPRPKYLAIDWTPLFAQ